MMNARYAVNTPMSSPDVPYNLLFKLKYPAIKNSKYPAMQIEISCPKKRVSLTFLAHIRIFLDFGFQ